MAEKILMMALSPTMDEGTITAWKVKEGDAVKSGDVLCEVETDKAVMEYESAAAGTLLKLVKAAGEKARVGDLIAIIGKPGEDFGVLVGPAPAAAAAPKPASAAQAVPPAAAGQPAPQPAGRQRSSPLARELARRQGIDIRGLSGSGPGGRVIRRDLAAPSGPARAGEPPAGRAPAAGDESVPVSAMRAAIARRLSESMSSAPHFYLSASVGMDRLLELRAALNAAGPDKLSLNAFLMKLSAAAIKSNPTINAAWKGGTIERRASIDIGLAVALPDGLITPLVKDCGSKGVRAIEAELVDLIARARKGGLRPEEYSGAGFTISNLGSYGIDEFTAIINPPASAILAVGAVSKQPVVDEHDQLAVRRMVRLTASCDHRVIDGAVGAAFMRDLKAIIEEPARALI